MTTATARYCRRSHSHELREKRTSDTEDLELPEVLDHAI